jgi:hypothetical protein
LAEDSLTNEQILKWPVSDDLSGVSEATVTLNGKWLLSWYDPRDKMVYIPLNKEQLSAGKLELQMDVYDAVGNTAHFSQNW